MQNKKQIETFIKTIFGDNLTEGLLNIRLGHDTHSIEIDEVHAVVSKKIEFTPPIFTNIEYEACLQSTVTPLDERGKSLVMPGVWAVVCQDDFSLEKFIDTFSIEPTLIVEIDMMNIKTYELYFLFREPLVFRSDSDRNSGQDLIRRFQNHLKDQGWNFQDTSDLRALLTVPFDTVIKHAKILKQCLENKYTPEDIRKLLETPPPPPPVAMAASPSIPPLGLEVEQFNNTDLGNAERLVSKYGEDVRYCPQWNTWMYWNGKVWRKDVTGEIERKAKQTVKDLKDEIPSGAEAKFAFKHAHRSESRYSIENMVALAKSEIGVPILPNEMDSDTGWLFNCNNGTINLRTGELKPHNKSDTITKISPVDFDPDAECPVFMEFLSKIMNGNQNLIEFLNRAVGYSLTGNISEQVLFFLYGTGANGKSTFLEVIRMMMGEYAQQADFNTFLQQSGTTVRNDIARLKGARFVTAVEVEDGRRLSEVMVKQITGGDLLIARFLYGEYFEFYPEFKLFWAANHKPIVWGTDHGFWRRMRLVPFEVTISEAEMDKNLGEKLQAELPGILAWAVRGCTMWQKIGLKPPPEVLAATSMYREEQDDIGEFFNACCKMKKDATVTKAKLYQAFQDWCEKNGEKPMPKRRFGSKLKERGISDGKLSGDRVWLGIDLLVEESSCVVPTQEIPFLSDDYDNVFPLNSGG